MSSVISARRRWEGRISELEGGEELRAESVGEAVRGVYDGFKSARTEGGEIGSSIEEEEDGEGGGTAREDLGDRDVAPDMRRTRRGRMCLPSDVV